MLQYLLFRIGDCTLTADQWAMAGILISLILGVPAYFVAKSIHKNNQSQSVGDNSHAIQAGRDVRTDKHND